MTKHAEFECSNCGNNAHCHLTVEMMENENINKMIKCKWVSTFVEKPVKKLYRCCNCEKKFNKVQAEKCHYSCTVCGCTLDPIT